MSELKLDELDQYRSQIDVLDRRLLDLLNERTAVVEQHWARQTGTRPSRL